MKMGNKSNWDPKCLSEAKEVKEMWMSNKRDMGMNRIFEHKKVDDMGLVERRDQVMQMTKRKERKVAKKCQYCDSTETLHWREGHMLCNECISQYQFGRQSPEHSPLRSSKNDPCSCSHFAKNVEQNRIVSRSYLRDKRGVEKCLHCASSLSDEIEDSDPSKQVRSRKISELLGYGYSDQAVKKCMNFETTETLSWRTGPMGQKTLCNVHGVPYQHSRIFTGYHSIKSPTCNPSLRFTLPNKVQEVRMGNTIEEDSYPTPEGLKLKKVKETRPGNNTYERDPNYTCKPKKVVKSISSTCERDRNPTPKVKRVEMRNTNKIDLVQTVISESDRVEEMIFKISGSSLKLTSEAKSFKEMSFGNHFERDQDQVHKGKNFHEMRQKANNLIESDICESNKNNGSDRMVKRKLLTVTKVTKCTHCESTETPQWREGPMGRNTLCNACGVQYRRGKLFPEYRPLKSPTYDPLIHSYLPKKVLKMRMRNAEKCAASATVKN